MKVSEAVEFIMWIAKFDNGCHVNSLEGALLSLHACFCHRPCPLSCIAKTVA